MEKLEIRKLSQAMKNTTNKIKFCATLAVTELDEDAVDGLSLILQDCAEEMEQAAEAIDTLKPANFTTQKPQNLRQHFPTLVKVSSGEQMPA